MNGIENTYNTTSTDHQLGNLPKEIRHTCVTLGQSKLQIFRLRRHYQAPQIRSLLDLMATSLDAMTSRLESLPSGRGPGGVE